MSFIARPATSATDESIRSDGFVSTARYKLAQLGQTHGCRPLADWSVTIKGNEYNAFSVLTSVPMLAAAASASMLRDRPLADLAYSDAADSDGCWFKREYLATLLQKDIRAGLPNLPPPRTVEIDKVSYEGKIDTETLIALWKEPVREADKKRTLTIEAGEARMASSALALGFGAFYSKRMSNNVMGCRPGVTLPMTLGSVRHAVNETGKKVVLMADLENFFGSVPCDRVMNHLNRDTKYRDIPELKRLLERLIPKRGFLPQGNPLSPLLANLYGQETIDPCLAQQGPWVRYVDDILVLYDSVEQAKRGFEVIQASALKMGLKIHTGKSAILDLGNGQTYSFTKEAAPTRYLGVNMALEAEGLTFSLANRSIRSLHEHLRRVDKTKPPKDPHPTVTSLYKISRSLHIVVGWLQAYGFAQFTAEQEAALTTILSLSGLTEEGFNCRIQQFKEKFATDPDKFKHDLAGIFSYLCAADKRDNPEDFMNPMEIFNDHRMQSKMRFKEALRFPADLPWMDGRKHCHTKPRSRLAEVGSILPEHDFPAPVGDALRRPHGRPELGNAACLPVAYQYRVKERDDDDDEEVVECF